MSNLPVKYNSQRRDPVEGCQPVVKSHMKTTKWGEGQRLLECVTIGPHYCEQDVVNAVIDDHSVDKICFQGPEEDDGKGIDDDDEPDGRDHQVQDGQVIGHVHLCHGVGSEIQLFYPTGVLFDICGVESGEVAHTD